MPYPGLQHPEPLPLQQSTADPYLHKRHSNTVLAQFLWGLCVLVLTRFVRALQPSLVGMGFDSKCNFAPPTVLLGLLLCPWTWGIFFGGIQHFPLNGCSAASCNFGVLTWEDECTSSYSTTLLLILSISDFFIKVSSMNHQKWLRFPTLLITDTVDNLMYCCCLFYFACACEGGNWKMPRIFT